MTEASSRGDGGDGGKLVDATMAELAFLFVFAIFVALALAAAATTTSSRVAETREALDALVASIDDVDCACTVTGDEDSSDLNIYRIRLSCQNGRELFESGEAGFAPAGEACFRALCPPLYNHASAEIADDRLTSLSVQDITIEGHADGNWQDPTGGSFMLGRTEVGCSGGPQCNHFLSSMRSLYVYTHCSAFFAEADGLETSLSPEERIAFFDTITSNQGFGQRELIDVFEDDAANDAASRRVEFVLRLRD